jgi:hypothetical protein
LGIVSANYPQKITKVNQHQNNKTLISQAFDQHCPSLSRAMFLTRNEQVVGSNPTIGSRKSSNGKASRAGSACHWFLQGESVPESVPNIF